MLPVVEMFTSIQGEGKYSGVPSHFVRVSGCNLRCVFKDSVCDTPYSSFKPEKPIANSMEELVQKFKLMQMENPRVKHVVITGGEPLMYRKDLEDFVGAIYDDDMKITIETNGTYPILNPLSARNRFKIALYSVSPKLHTSVGKPGDYNGIKVTQEMVDRHDKQRINIENLVNIALNAEDYQFKFVYSGPECVDEIMDIYTKMGALVERMEMFPQSYYFKNHPFRHTMLMPEGITNEQLAAKRKEIAEICIKNGWFYSDRIHIVIWGDKRGV